MIWLGVTLAATNRALADEWSPLWSTASLFEARGGLSAAAAGGKVYFAGGALPLGLSDTVDIYDSAINSWSHSRLSNVGDGIAAASWNGKAYFGGGQLNISDKVAIFDSSAGTQTEITMAQGHLGPAGAAANGKVLFAGGTPIFPPAIPDYSKVTAVVEILNTSNNGISTSALSQARGGIAGAAWGDKVYFAGGSPTSSTFSNKIDIYDTTSASWTTATLSQARTYFTGASANGKVVFAGGVRSGGRSDVVDILDTATNTWSTAHLSVARAGLTSASAGGKIFFAGGSTPTRTNVVDIYDANTNSWTTSNLSIPREDLAAASVGNKVLFGGGYISSSSSTNRVDIYTLQNYPSINSSIAFTLVDHTTVAGLMNLNASANLGLGSFNLTVGSMSGAGAINLSNRTLTLGTDGTSTTYAGAITGASGSALVKTGSGKLTLTNSVNVMGNVAVNGGAIDLDDNALIIHSGDVGSWNGSTYTGLSGLIRSGRNEGTWDGTGIITSRPNAASNFTTIGIATADEAGAAGGTFAGVSVASGDLLIAYTYAGDANLDGVINSDDYALIDFFAGTNQPTYYRGDFNYDGSINADDYSLIDFNLAHQSGPASLTAVPEPGGMIGICGLLPALYRRRRRRFSPPLAAGTPPAASGGLDR